MTTQFKVATQYLSAEAIRMLELRIGKSSVDSWFRSAMVSTYNNNSGNNSGSTCDDNSGNTSNKGLTVLFPSSFIKTWVNNNYSDALTHALHLAYGAQDISLGVNSKAEQYGKMGELSSFSLPLDTNMTFSTFVSGESNQMAYAACKQASIGNGIFNPLFLYANSGNGKTHLMQALAWEAIKLGKKVCYISAEQYMLLFIRALRDREMIIFKNSFREVDLLMIDDFQFMQGKDSTQEEFFYTFVYLISLQKQIVISADKSPMDLSGIESRLRSRLNGGLVANISPASQQLRFIILEQKAKQYNKNISHDIIKMISYGVDNSIRELEGALLRICAQIEFFGEEITLENAKKILGDIICNTQTEITLDFIVNTVSSFYGLEDSLITPKSRERKLINARQIAMFFCRSLKKKSLPEISKFFGAKDHTNVLYSIKQVKRKMMDDPEFESEVEHIRKSIQNGQG